MKAASVDKFVRSLRDHSVSCSRTTTSEAPPLLRDLLEQPAVGTPSEYGLLTDVDVATDPTPSDLMAGKTGVTDAELGIADYGSVLVSTRNDTAELVSLFAETHIAIVAESTIVPSMSDAVDVIGNEVEQGLSNTIIATGPSATADMGELVLGAHGPKSVHVVLLTDQ